MPEKTRGDPSRPPLVKSVVTRGKTADIARSLYARLLIKTTEKRMDAVRSRLSKVP